MKKESFLKILMKLLKGRKDTRKKIKYKTVKSKCGREFSGLLEEDNEDKIIIKNVEGQSEEFVKSEIETIVETYNEFEQEVLDGLQLTIKLLLILFMVRLVLQQVHLS